MASALFLARNGFNIIVMEQATALEEIGAGIQLSPNAMQVLVQLGLDRQIKMVAVAPTFVSMHDACTAKRIVTIPLGASVLSNYGQPYLSIHRADLQKVLFAACEAEPDVTIKLGTKVEDYSEHANGSSILATKDYRPHTHAAIGLIGADGVNSAIRTTVLGFEEPTITNRIALRSMIPIEAVPDPIDTENISVWMAKNAHLVLYPVNSGSYLNLVAFCDKPTGEKLSEIDPRKLFEKAALRWNPVLRGLTDHSSNMTAWPVTYSKMPRNWHKGNVGLIGDAAHAMLPHSAQGAAMALEDAATLSTLLNPGVSIENAFSKLATLRRKRISKLSKLSVTNGKIYTMGGMGATARNLAMRMLGGRLLLQRQHWIYDWNSAIN